MSRISDLYHRLPIIAELRAIRRSLRLLRAETAAIRGYMRNLAVAESVRLLHFELARHPRYSDPKRLLAYAHQTFSQDGEDGMIAEICRRIGAPSHRFVEIGVGNGLENNTTFLLTQNWRGWWIEADAAAVSSIQSTFRQEIATGALSVRQAIVTAENIDALLTESGVPTEFDLLSLDVDRNTYWVWAAMARYRPRIVVIEYNAAFPPGVDWKVEYRPEAQWKGTSYFAASLKALELLGREMGYALVGCNFTGVNAFFVREDLCADHFAQPFTAENHYEPARYYLSPRLAHPPGFRDA